MNPLQSTPSPILSNACQTPSRTLSALGWSLARGWRPPSPPRNASSPSTSAHADQLAEEVAEIARKFADEAAKVARKSEGAG